VLVGEDSDLEAVAEAQLGQHPGDVGLDSGLGDGERAGNDAAASSTIVNTS
jgi:hypothetical protein